MNAQLPANFAMLSALTERGQLAGLLLRVHRNAARGQQVQDLLVRHIVADIRKDLADEFFVFFHKNSFPECGAAKRCAAAIVILKKIFRM